MTRLLLPGAILIAVSLHSAATIAQSSPSWQACRKDPSRTCLLAEAFGRLRDDAPAARDLRLVEWERLLYLRLSDMAAVTRDRALFDEARGSALANSTEDTRRSALRWIAAAQARSGFPDDALHTLGENDDGGFAAGEIAIALVRAGRIDEARQVTERIISLEAQVGALIGLAQATGSADWLRRAHDFVREPGDSQVRGALMARLAVAHAQSRQPDQAMTLAGSITVGYHRARALAGIAAAMRDPAVLAEARRLAADPDGRGDENEAWAAIARAEIALGMLNEARATLEAHLPQAPTRALATAVGELAAAHWLAGDSRSADRLIDALLGGSWAIGEARAILARQLIDRRRFDEARRLSFLADEITFDNLSAEIALKQASTGAIAEALETADSIQHPARRSPTLAEIASLMPH